MSPSQLLFLALDGVITAILVMLVLRRRKSESGASDDLRASTTTVTFGTPATTSALHSPSALDTPRAAAVTGPPGAAAIAGAPATTPETGSLTRMFGRGQLRGLATFAADQNERIAAYVRDKWSGVPEQLPAVLDALLTELERAAEEKGLWLDRETLKSMLVVALRSNRIVDSDVALEALAKVA